MKIILFLFILSFVTPCFHSSGKIYRNKDENGNIIYSDRSTEESVEVMLPEINTMQSGDAKTKQSEAVKTESTEKDSNLVPIVESYFFDNSSLKFNPQYSERVRTMRAGRIYFETMTYPESWSFDIIRGDKRIPCKMLCRDDNYPELMSGRNMPMGVLRYLQTSICDTDENRR